ncbi:hypothetical protein L6452_46118 [Arctium lappa]|nr:hypothetical protein L6452_46118 [Arctium lappa]
MGTGDQSPPKRHASPLGRRGRGRRDAWTPRQTCPRPNGFGRNLRFKKLDGSRDSAIHTKYRILLRSSSMRSVEFSRRRRRRTALVAAILTLHRTIQSVGATGGVYKGQGRSQRELMTRGLLGIPRLRPTIAMIYPHHDENFKDFPGLSAKGYILVEYISCSARAAQNI